MVPWLRTVSSQHVVSWIPVRWLPGSQEWMTSATRWAVLSIGSDRRYMRKTRPEDSNEDFADRLKGG
jgi:hypothetical protein